MAASSSTFVAPLVAPPGLPGGAEAVAPASSFTPGLSVATKPAATAAAATAGARPPNAPHASGVPQTPVASAGPHFVVRRPTLARRTAGDAEAAGVRPGTVAPPRPDEALAYGKSPPGRGHLSALAEAPTVAAVAEVLSSLVSVLSPLPTAGGAAHTAAAPVATTSSASAAAVATPSERTTPPQVQSQTTEQSPVEAAAAALAAAATPARPVRATAAADVVPARPLPPLGAPAPAAGEPVTPAPVLSPTPRQGAVGAAAAAAAAARVAAAAAPAPAGGTVTAVAVTPTEPASRPTGHSALKAALGYSLASHPYASGRRDAAAWQRLSAAAAPESNVAHAGQGQESPAGRSPLEWVAAGVTRPAAVGPSGKAAVVAAAALPGMAALLHPEPSTESPLERAAEALFPMAEAGAAVAPPAKATVAAVTPPPDMAALLHPEPSMESPLERAAEALFPLAGAGAAVAPPTKSTVAAVTPLPDMAALLHPEPSMESPLERAAEALFPVAEVGTVVGPRSAVDLPAKATVTAVTAAPDMAALLHPEPSMASPLERAAAGLFSPPVATTPVAQGAAVAAVAGEAREGGAAPRAGRRSVAPPLWLMALGSTATLGLLLVITRYPALLVIAGGVASVLVFLFPPDTTDA